MKTPETLVGLFGVQHPHAERHLRTLINLPEVDGIVLWDENAAAMGKMHSRYGQKVRANYTDLDLALGRGDLTFVIAGIRHDLSTELMLRIVRAGVPLLAEKPGGRNADELLAVVKAAESCRCPFGVLYTNRYHPVVRKARELFAAGILGPLMLADMRMFTSQVQFREPGSWIHQRCSSGGGVLTWLGCHYLDLMSYIPNDTIEWVQAGIALRGSEQIDVEDVAVLTVQFQSGAIGSFSCGYTSRLAGSGYEGSRINNFFAFHGRDGMISRPELWTLHAESGHQDWADQPLREFVYEKSKSDSYGGSFGEAFVRDFLQSIRDGTSPPVTGRDALDVFQVIKAAYESNETGMRVRVRAAAPDSGSP